MNKYVIILIIVLALAIIFWVMAFRSMKRTGKIRRETMAKLDRIKSISERYAALTSADLDEISDADLFDAVIIRIWKKLGTQEEEMENFAALSDEERNIYTAWYVREEVTNEGFSAYFRNCGHSLGELSVGVMDALGLSELDNVLKSACEMFDENSEVSCDKESVKAVNERFRAAYDADAYANAAAEYIKRNADKFVDTIEE